MSREGRIAELEARYAITLPQDFRRYLAEECSVEDRLDDEWTMWWGLEAICSVADGSEHPIKGELEGVDTNKYLFFADAMAWAWAWAIACTDDDHRGKIVITVGTNDRFVADSFDDFLRLYAENPEQLY